jgi:carbon-monoxide dehydrogenase large subunit
MARLKIGDTPRRSEDTRFLTGHGRYIDDMVLGGMVHAVIVRSPHAHADIVGIDKAAAAASAGVLAVLTRADQRAAGILPMQPYETVNVYTNQPFTFPTQYPLAVDRVRYAGEPVAVVVAETLDQARDAAELLDVSYRPLPAVTTVEAAVASDRENNVCLRWAKGDAAAVDAAIAGAAHVTRMRIHNHRVITNAMEPRGAIAEYDPASGRYTVHLSAQSIHMARDRAAMSLGVAPSQVRFVAPDVGGGFGVKNFAYPEQVLLPWAARVVGRPVKWINARSDGFVSDHQARDHTAQAALALDADGRFLALQVSGWGNLGAYLCGSAGRLQTEQHATLPGGPYLIPAIHLEINAAFTNTVPIGVTRGPGFAESANITERLIDRAADEMGLDRIDLRRRNLAGAWPYTNAVGHAIDSGAFPDNFDRAMARAREGFDDRRRESEARGRRRGLGVAYHIKGTFGAPEENVELRFNADDTVTFTTGTQSIGQGHETTFPQLVSHLLGVPFEHIQYRQGDTDIIPKGGGHGSSRATYMGGTATFKAVERIVGRGKRTAARVLEAAEADFEFRDGRFEIAGTDRGLDIFEVARHAREEDGKGLDTLQDFTREALTFPNGCHVAEVEVDPDTGKVTVQRYTAVDDYGTVINPMVVTGQVHGAITQGIGQALMERAAYDPSTGQLLSGSFMDYMVPRADEVPSYDVTLNGIPCATNPLGVKGSGEAGAIAGFPAVANAVIDALAPYGVKQLEGPASPENVWRAIQGAKGNG